MAGVDPAPAPVRSASLVAWYGREDAALAALREGLGNALLAALGDGFVPRPPRTLHTTVIGLDDAAPVPLGGEERRLREAAARDPAGLAAAVRAGLRDPLVVQVGGFPDADLPVSSRGQRLHHRSLVHDAGRGQVVLVGWPVTGDGTPTLRLDRLRHDLEGHGVRHRYADGEDWQDPDAHLVLGETRGDVRDVEPALADLRTRLAARPTRLVVRATDVRVVVYDDPRLPLDTTAVLPLSALG
jgi:hypothetical protein